MKRSKALLRLLAVGAILCCAVPGLGAQGQPAHKPASKTAPAPRKKPEAHLASTPAGPASAAAPKVSTQAQMNRRDPFAPLINDRKDTGGPEHLPPGKAGLVVATVRVDGTIKSPAGMLAVVSNPEQHVYFIREGDQLYDGDVEKIALDGVTFRENSKDAFGKSVERLITKRIYPTVGEQQ